MGAAEEASQRDRCVTPGTCLWPPGDRLRAILPPGAFASVKPVLWGDLSEMHAGDLLTMLEHQRRTGLLVTSSDGVERALVLVDGAVTWVRSGKPAERNQPSEVVVGLLGGEQGTFSFLRVAPRELPAGAPQETRALVLDGLRRLDEQRRE